MSEINEQEIFDELEKDELNEEIVKDNKYPFPYLGKDYRIVMPNQFQLTKARQYKHREFTKLVSNGVPVQSNWVKTLKETQNVDIDKLSEEIQKYENDLIQVSISSAKTKDSEEKTRAKFKQKFDEISKKRLELIYERARRLEPCAEFQVKELYYQYLTAECTEILINKEEDKWGKVWKSFENYQKEQSNLSIIAMGKLNDLLCY